MSGPVIDGVDFSELLTPGEVAEAFGVTSKTVGRWAVAGLIASISTVGGTRRFSRAQIEPMLGPFPLDRPRRLIGVLRAATLLNVDPKTVHSWARKGRFTCLRTPGGHMRLDCAEVEAAQQLRLGKARSDDTAKEAP